MVDEDASANAVKRAVGHFDHVHDLFTLTSANDDPLVVHAGFKFWPLDRAEDDRCLLARTHLVEELA